MILKACSIRSKSADPPMSRKFAGSAPAHLVMSIVAIANPAPLTMHPTRPPSSFTYARSNSDASRSSGSICAGSCNSRRSGCRKSASSSIPTFASNAKTPPSSVSTNGLISTKEQSLSVNSRYAFAINALTGLISADGKPNAKAAALAR